MSRKVASSKRMETCAVPSCKFMSKDLFRSPKAPTLLALWKKILKTEENSFAVCEAHFENTFVKVEKSLTKDAFPSVFIADVTVPDSNYCQCCLKSFVRSTFLWQTEEYFNIGPIVKNMYFDIIGCELQDGIICIKCYEQIKNFHTFRKSVLDKNEKRMELFQQNEPEEDPFQVQIKEEPMDEDIEEVIEVKEEYLDDSVVEIKEEPFDEMDLLTEIKAEHEEVQEQSKFVKITRLPIQPKYRILTKPNVRGPAKKPSTSSSIQISKEHLKRLCTPMMGFKCKYCPNTFIDMEFLEQHMRLRHNFKCTTCNAVFPYKISLVKHHMSAHGHNVAMLGGKSAMYKFQCDLCELKFMTQQSLERHRKHKHLTFNELTSVKIIEGPLRVVRTVASGSSSKSPEVSELAKKLSKIPKEATIEKLIKNILKPVQATPSEPLEEDKDGIPCLDCGLLYKPDKLLRHRTEVHDLNSRMRIFECDKCGDKIKGKVTLINHMMSRHLGSHYTKCEFCDALFENKTILVCHKNQMHNFNGTRYICHFCQLIFDSRRDMILHRKQHYSDKTSRKQLARVFCKKFTAYEPMGGSYK